MTESELAAIGAAILATDEVLSIVGKQLKTQPEVLDQIRLRFLLVSGRQFRCDLEALLRSEKEAIGNGKA